MNQRGAALLIVILILIVVAVVLAVFVSLINTESYTAMSQSASVRAFGIADGGIEYAFKRWGFPNYSTPPYSTRGPGQSLGDGSFVVDPPTVVTDNPLTAGATTVNVVSTTGFASSGRIVIGSEQIDYTGTTATSFTGATRGVGSSSASSHAIDDAVYPVTTLDGSLSAGSGVPEVVPVASTVGFLIPGSISIDSEVIYCTGTDTSTAVCGAGKVACFTDCIRGYKGTSDPGHGNGKPVFQYVITATGTVPLPVVGNAQRVIRVTAGLLN